MSRLVVCLAAVAALAALPGVAPAQVVVATYSYPTVAVAPAPVVVARYAPAPVVAYYPAPAVSYYAPTVSYYAPSVSYYTTPSVTTYRYPLLRPNTVIVRSYPGTVYAAPTAPVVVGP
jgi:hypothetical protein